MKLCPSCKLSKVSVMQRALSARPQCIYRRALPHGLSECNAFYGKVLGYQRGLGVID